jgi:hypothetical protein
MPGLDLDRLLGLLGDPEVESLTIATLAGVPREEAGRAARLLSGLARARPEDVLTLPGPLAAALGRAAAAAGRADLLAALAGHPGKEVVKEAKRGLHLLRTRGVSVPELPAPPAPAPAPAPAEPPLPAFASAPDGRGERAVWMARNVPGKGIEICQAVISDERGLVEAHVGLLGRKEWRAFAGSLVERGAAMAVAEVPAARAHALVADARALNETTGERVPEGADLWLARLGPLARAEPEPEPGPLPPGEEAEALLASADLHQLPLLRGWLADEAHLRATAARLDEVAASPLYLDERQRAEQAARVVAEAVESWLDPGRRALLARRLHAVARHLLDRNQPGHARAAAAAARALAAGTPGREIPFARLLLEKAFPPAPPPGVAPARIDPGVSLR